MARGQDHTRKPRLPLPQDSRRFWEERERRIRKMTALAARNRPVKDNLAELPKE